jgi:hypothetical protein
MGARSYVEIRHAVEQINDDGAGRQVCQQRGLDLPNVDVVGAEVSE